MDDLRKDIYQSIISLANDNSGSTLSQNLDEDVLDKYKVTNKFVNFDYSKQRINNNVLDFLLAIPDRINLKNSLNLLSEGKFLNPTEDITASHMLYRNLNQSAERKFIDKEQNKMRKFISFINDAESNIKNVIAIGIGGSRVGPELLSEIISEDSQTMKLYFCSSYDLIELKDALNKCKTKETILLISSKSFNTMEIIKNANFAKAWLRDSIGEQYVDHIYGISCNQDSMTKFGIKDENQIKILDSLGGRFSIWSPMGLPAFVNSGMEPYKDLIEGAREADKHLLSKSWKENIPVLMSLIGLWNTNGLNINNLGIFTYNYKLRSLTKYIAQLGMESNGKSFNSNNKKSAFYTSPLIWGGYGPEAQHSVFQWLMQGTDVSSCDFIGFRPEEDTLDDSYEMLLAQILALTQGKKYKGQKFKSIKGNNPTSLFQISSIDLKSIGFLISLYEHKIFIDSQIYNIDPFDQWGVQLGKELTNESKKDKRFLNRYFHRKFLSNS